MVMTQSKNENYISFEWLQDTKGGRKVRTNSVSKVFGTMTLPGTEKTGAMMQPEQSFETVLNGQTEENSGSGAYIMNAFSESDFSGKVQQTYEKERRETSYGEIEKAGGSSTKQISKVKDSKEELEDKVTKLLSEELDVSEEELKDIMAELGITLDSLINGTGLKDLMMALTGAEDMTELLLNDSFGNLMEGLEALVQEFSEQLAITPEELKTSLDTLSVDELQQISEQEMTGEFAQSNMDNMGEMSNMENTEEFGTTTQNDSAGTQQVTYREVQTTVNAVGEQVAQVVEQNFVDAEDIMRQITQFTRVTVQQTQSSIEMQLNPAHLGKVYLQVAAKNGVITAQLATENEAVKQALETQLTTLKENMNQQGLKVEAVEVTIASHAFEQNLEGNQQSAQEDLQQENNKTHRFLTEDNLDELSGMMTEEEKIAAQIMRDNGNRMDVMA